MTKSTLDQCRQADIMAYRPEDLVDLSTIHIDPTLPRRERTEQFLNQVQNPYLFRVDNLVIKVRFSGDRSFASALAALC